MIRLLLRGIAVFVFGSTFICAQESNPDVARSLKAIDQMGGTYERAVVNVSLAKAKVLSHAEIRNLVPLREHLRSLSLRSSPVIDEGLSEIHWLSELTELDLAGTRITDGVLKNVAPLTKLRTLNLSDTEITGRTFYELRGLKELEHLGLSGTKIDGEVLKLLKLLPWLKELSLQETGVDNLGVSQLRVLVNLEDLSLRDTAISGDGGFGSGLPQVLVRLQRLRLSRTMVDDRCIPHVAQFPALVSFSLDGTRVSAAGVAQLAEFKDQGHLKRLDYLYVSPSQLTEETRARLMEAFPRLNLRVVEDRPPAD